MLDMSSAMYRALEGDEQTSPIDPEKSSSKPRSIPKPTRSSLRDASYLLLSVIALAAVAGYVGSRVFVWRMGQCVSEQPALLPTAFFPNFGKKSIVFENGGDFTRSDEYGDALWNSLVPLGAGYIRVPDPRRFDLPQSQPLTDNGSGAYAEMFQASVIHQLHCMAVLRNTTRAYERGLPPPPGMKGHTQHCIEYIRQAILCTADTTLEQADAKGAFNAQGAVHQCRDWDLVKAFLEDNRADDDHPDILDT